MAEKLDNLNGMLMGVENKLAHRALSRSRKELEGAVGFINDLASKGIVDIQCSDCPGGEESPPSGE